MAEFDQRTATTSQREWLTWFPELDRFFKHFNIQAMRFETEKDGQLAEFEFGPAGRLVPSDRAWGPDRSHAPNCAYRNKGECDCPKSERAARTDLCETCKEPEHDCCPLELEDNCSCCQNTRENMERMGD